VFMREQRHAARANRARAEASERGMGDDPPPRQAPARRLEPAARSPDADAVPGVRRHPADNAPDYTELNAYMREQRHAARANKARAEAAENHAPM
jgi:hypothetical protein